MLYSCTAHFLVLHTTVSAHMVSLALWCIASQSRIQSTNHIMAHRPVTERRGFLASAGSHSPVAHLAVNATTHSGGGVRALGSCDRMREVGKRSLKKKEITACMRDDRSHIVPCRWMRVLRMIRNIGSSSLRLTARLCDMSASMNGCPSILCEGAGPRSKRGNNRRVLLTVRRRISTCKLCCVTSRACIEPQYGNVWNSEQSAEKER